jgi:flagellar biosynthesis protein FlhF
MFIKKFTAPSLEEALAQIKKELGPDTFILQTDQKPSSFFKKKQIEVTVASQKDPKQALNSEKLSEVFPHRKKEILDRQNSQRPEKETKNPPQKSQTSPPVASNSVPPDPAENKLRLMGFSEETIKKCAQHLIFEFSREDRANKRIFEKTVSELLAKGIKTLSRSVFESRRCWVAVGLPGSGKTTVLAKLALVLKPH